MSMREDERGADERFLKSNRHDYGNNSVQESVNPRARLP